MDPLRFTDRVAIVTGGGSGLGRQHSLLLASRGVAVLVNDSGGALDGTAPDPSVAQRVVDEIRNAGGVAVADSTSVATPEGGAAIVAAARQEFGRLDIVINNAGILRDRTIQNVDPADLEAVLSVHLKGAFNVTTPAFTVMREQKFGRIVSTSSSAGLFGNFGQSAYGAAKMGLIGLTHVLAVEGAKYGILANAIAPLAHTRMTENLMGEDGPRFDAALVSPVVAYLCSDDCTVTGEIYAVGAGRVARVFIGETPGICRTALNPEDVRDHLSEIRDLNDYTIPANTPEESALFAEARLQQLLR